MEPLRIKVINGPCIYVLFHNGICQYVGQSKKGSCRAFHPKNRHFVFDYAEIYECGIAELDELENNFIFEKQPIHNKSMNLNAKCNGESIVSFNIKHQSKLLQQKHKNVRPIFGNYYYLKSLSN